MGANTGILARLEAAEGTAARPGSKLAVSLAKHKEEAELLEFALREATSDWYYDLELNGADIEGIGIGGAMELARFRAEQGYPIRLQNGIELIEVERNGARGVQATVVAREAKTAREGVGVAFFPYFVDAPAGELQGETQRVADTRADRKALSIAKRNAILDLIPEEVQRRILAERKRIVPINEARNEDEAALVRRLSAVPIRRVTAEENRLEGMNPYERPDPVKSIPVATRQIIRLAQLIANPLVPESVRATVNARLLKGLSEQLATEWIGILEAEVGVEA
jgi:hypothetical protein